MNSQIELGDISVDVIRKDIKNVHLSVYPPTGRVRIAAPARMDLDTIRVFAISKIGWIRNQQKKVREQEREEPREYVDRESHYLWGRRYLLKITETSGRAGVEVKHNRLVLNVPPDSDAARRQTVLEAWYREQLRLTTPSLISRWESLMEVKVARFYVRRMKTRWGSCTADTRTIHLNTELAKKPLACLDYIILHEMVHLIEPNHGDRFKALMDRYMPGWRVHRSELNRLPVRHEHWLY